MPPIWTNFVKRPEVPDLTLVVGGRLSFEVRARSLAEASDVFRRDLNQHAVSGRDPDGQPCRYWPEVLHLRETNPHALELLLGVIHGARVPDGLPGNVQLIDIAMLSYEYGIVHLLRHGAVPWLRDAYVEFEMTVAHDPERWRAWSIGLIWGAWVFGDARLLNEQLCRLLFNISKAPEKCWCSQAPKDVANAIPDGIISSDFNAITEGLDESCRILLDLKILEHLTSLWLRITRGTFDALKAPGKFCDCPGKRDMRYLYEALEIAYLEELGNKPVDLDDNWTGSLASLRYRLRDIKHNFYNKLGTQSELVSHFGVGGLRRLLARIDDLWHDKEYLPSIHLTEHHHHHLWHQRQKLDLHVPYGRPPENYHIWDLPS